MTTEKSACSIMAEDIVRPYRGLHRIASYLRWPALAFMAKPPNGAASIPASVLCRLDVADSDLAAASVLLGIESDLLAFD